jgi:single stranded DNA-binding protein
MDLNVVALNGRLVADPQFHATDDGGDVTILPLAVARAKRRGQQRPDVDHINVVVIDQVEAPRAARYLAKNSRVGVQGHLREHTWDSPQGRRTRVQVVADRIQYVDVRDRGAQQPRQPRTAGHNGAAQAEPAQAQPTGGAAAATTGGGEPAPNAAVEVVATVDGGCRGNPGPAGYGVVVTDASGTVLAELAEGIGYSTNNAAEYRAVLAALQHAHELGARVVEVRSDSKLVVNQLNGDAQVRKAALQPLHEQALRLAGNFDRVTFRHVPREANARADALANQAMDEQAKADAPATAGAPAAATS